MTNLIINAATFEATEDQGTYQRGTVEVTLGNVTRRVRASRFANAIHAYEFTGRYATSAKNWPATVTQRTAANGEVYETASFGRDDRDPKFNKLRGISLA